eukprot:RCo024727
MPTRSSPTMGLSPIIPKRCPTKRTATMNITHASRFSNSTAIVGESAEKGQRVVLDLLLCRPYVLQLPPHLAPSNPAAVRAPDGRQMSVEYEFGRAMRSECEPTPHSVQLASLS